jgi:hypothetical protein
LKKNKNRRNNRSVSSASSVVSTPLKALNGTWKNFPAAELAQTPTSTTARSSSDQRLDSSMNPGSSNDTAEQVHCPQHQRQDEDFCRLLADALANPTPNKRDKDGAGRQQAGEHHVPTKSRPGSIMPTPRGPVTGDLQAKDAAGTARSGNAGTANRQRIDSEDSVALSRVTGLARDRCGSRDCSQSDTTDTKLGGGDTPLDPAQARARHKPASAPRRRKPISLCCGLLAFTYPGSERAASKEKSSHHGSGRTHGERPSSNKPKKPPRRSPRPDEATGSAGQRRGQSTRAAAAGSAGAAGPGSTV